MDSLAQSCKHFPPQSTNLSSKYSKTGLNSNISDRGSKKSVLGKRSNKKSKFAQMPVNDLSSVNSSDEFEHISEQNMAAPDTSYQNQALRIGKMIGPITETERLSRIMRYLKKKRERKESHKYSCRANVATKRLRVRGRFVTKEQAFELLGISENDLSSNQ